MNQNFSGIKRFPQPTVRVSELGDVPISISHTQAILSYIVTTHGKPHNLDMQCAECHSTIEFRPIARVRPYPCDAKFSPGRRVRHLHINSVSSGESVGDGERQRA